MTGLERLATAVDEFREAANQTLAELHTPDSGQPLTYEELQGLIADRTPMEVLRLLRDTIDVIHSARTRDGWIDKGFRKLGIVTKDTAGFQFPGEIR